MTKNTNIIKNVVIAIMAIVIYILFRPVFENLLSKIINITFQHFVFSIFADIIFFASLMVLVIWTMIKMFDYTLPVKVYIYSTTFYIIYLFYRFGFFESFILFPLILTPDLMYSDILTALWLSSTAILLSKKNKTNTSSKFQEPIFIEDISTIRDEFKSFKPYSEKIALKIQQMRVSNSFTIGLNGSWGSGKSTLFEMIKSELNKSDIIVFDFKPWNSNGSSSYSKDFFTLLEKELSPFHFNIQLTIHRYLNQIADNSGNYLYSIVSSILPYLGLQESQNTAYTSLKEAIAKINKPIVIFIDDIDRLVSSEILEVLKLIRSTANFPNLIFLISYDKAFINELLKNQGSNGYEKFLDKIIQLELSLPNVNSENLKIFFKNKLSKSFGENSFKLLEESIDKAIENNYDFNKLFIETPRDVVRLTNSIALHYPLIKNEVYIGDYLKIEGLRLKYPRFYNKLRNYQHLFFQKVPDNPELLMLRETSGINIPDKTTHSSYKYEFQKYLYEDEENNYLKNAEKDLLFEFVSSLFTYIDKSQTNPLSIIFAHQFDAYFKYSFFEEELTQNEFEKSLYLNNEEILEIFSHWLNPNLRHLAITRFKYLNFKDKVDFENKFEKTLLFGDLLNKKEDLTRRFDLHFYTNTVNLLKQNNQFFKDKYSIKSEFENFFKKNMLNKNFDNQFISKFLNELINSTPPDFFLSNEVLYSMTLTVFEQNLEKSTVLNEEIWSLYQTHFFKKLPWMDKKSLLFQTPEKIVHPLTKAVFQKWILDNHIDEYLCWCIRQNIYATGVYYSLFENHVSVFNTVDELIQSIENVGFNSDVFNEFKIFNEEFKSLSKNEIYKEFKHLTPKISNDRTQF